jgi:hypothetical protein
VEEEDEGIIQTTELTFEGENIKQEVSRAKKLISTIYKKIIALDFPETEQYPKTIEGIVAFEEDLLKGVV